MELQWTRNTAIRTTTRAIRAGMAIGWMVLGAGASNGALSAVMHFEQPKVDPVTHVISLSLDLDTPIDLSSLQVDLSGVGAADSVLDAAPKQLPTDPSWSTAIPGLPPTTVFWFSLANQNHRFDAGPLMAWNFAPNTNLSFLQASAVGYDAAFDPLSGKPPPLSVTIPEPSTGGLLLCGAIALAVGVVRRKRAWVRNGG